MPRWIPWRADFLRANLFFGWGWPAAVIVPVIGAPPALGQCLERQKLTASDAAASDEFGNSVSISGDVAVVGAYGDNCPAGIVCGSAYVYHYNATTFTWEEEQKLSASDATASDGFGRSVSVDGDVAVVGATGHSCAAGTECGSAYVYRYDGTTWVQQQKLTASDATAFDFFGRSVSVSGDVAVVGAYGDDCAAGAACGSAYVYRFNGTNWIQQQRLTASDASASARFGGSVSVDGDVAVVGADLDNCAAGSDCGSAYVYRYNGTTWVQQQKLTASDAAGGDFFGVSVSVSGNWAMVGADWYDCAAGSNCGSAYVFRYNATTWVEQQKLTASDAAAFQNFGNSVSVSGALAVVGAGGFGCPAGAFVYRLNNATTWVLHHPLTASDASAGDEFGHSVSISEGGLAVVGALYDDCAAGADCGSAHVFKVPAESDRDGDGLTDVWEETGIDFNMDGTIDLTLPDANPDHKDLYVEVDAMVGRSPATLADVAAAFAAVPKCQVHNPDGLPGITLHIDVDDTNIPLASWIPTLAMDELDFFDAAKADYFGTAAQRADANMANILAAKKKAYRYCIFADEFDGEGTSGLSEGIPSNDFMVTLGQWRTPGGTADQKAGTFMHELGHTLGQRHGGIDHKSYKPNYRSVMNYTWQTPNPNLPGWGLRYSESEYPSLNENNLSEPAGIGASTCVGGPTPGMICTMTSQCGTGGVCTASSGSTLSCKCVAPGCTRDFKTITENGPVDWNRNMDGGIDMGVMADINCSSTIETLDGYDNWSNLHYALCGNTDFADRAQRSAPVDELDLPTERAMEQPTCTSNEQCNDGTPCSYEVCHPAGVCQFTYVKYGDVAPDPNGVVDLNDILCVLDAFATPLVCPNADLAPCRPSGGIDLDDILAVLDAFGGADPCGCSAGT